MSVNLYNSIASTSQPVVSRATDPNGVQWQDQWDDTNQGGCLIDTDLEWQGQVQKEITRFCTSALLHFLHLVTSRVIRNKQTARKRGA